MSLLDTTSEGNNRAVAIGLISEIYKNADKQALDVWTDNTDESEHIFFKESLSYFGIVELNHKLATEWKEKDAELTEMARKNTALVVELNAMEKLKKMQDEIISSLHQQVYDLIGQLRVK